MKPGWVYILRCADETYYTGVTSDIDSRIVEHQEGVHKGYIYSRRPVILVWSDWFPDIRQAIAMEKQIKGWRRAKKEALISGKYNLLPVLARTARKKRCVSLRRAQTDTGLFKKTWSP
jgi:putative endonuclease